MPDLLPALAERRARRAFDPRPVSGDIQEALWQAVSVAPSHGNAQAVRLLVARAVDARERVAAALSEGNRGWAGAAPLLIAIATNPEHERADAYGAERAIWALHAGIALGNLMAQATAMGLTAHPMGGFDEAAVRQAFGAPAALRVLAVVACGYPGDPASLPEDLRAREARPQRRIPLDALVAYDAWLPQHDRPARGEGRER